MNIKKISIGLLFLMLALVIVPGATAQYQYQAPGQALYGSGFNCGTCHIDPNGGGTRTAYGLLFEAVSTHNTDPSGALTAIGSPFTTSTPTPTPTSAPVVADPTEVTDPTVIADPTEVTDPAVVADPTEVADPIEVADPTVVADPAPAHDNAQDGKHLGAHHHHRMRWNSRSQE